MQAPTWNQCGDKDPDLHKGQPAVPGDFGTLVPQMFTQVPTWNRCGDHDSDIRRSHSQHAGGLEDVDPFVQNTHSVVVQTDKLIGKLQRKGGNKCSLDTTD